MGFRFRRSIKLLPGIRLNLGKRGISTSIGVRGMHVTIGHGKVRQTVGLPGTGLSYTHTSSTAHHRPVLSPRAATLRAEVPAVGNARRGFGWILIAVLMLTWFVVQLGSS